MKNKLSFLICAILLSISIKAQTSFIHISDIHVADGFSAGEYDLDGVRFKIMRDNINNLSPKPAFVVATGDISHAGDYGTDGMYPALTQHLYPSGVVNPSVGDYFIDSLQTIPIYFTPGNHDFRYTNAPPLSGSGLAKYMSNICSELDYFIEFPNAVIIFMNSGNDDLRPLWEDANFMSPESSGFSDQQINWLRDILAVNSNKRKIILMHSPPMNVVGSLCDGDEYSGTFVDFADGSLKYNRDVFMNICDSNNVDIVLAGHAHQNVVVNRSGNIVNENWLDSTRYVQTGAALNGCYRVITIDSNVITVGTPQIDELSSIDEKNISKFEIFPNPSSGKFIIEMENGQSENGIVEVFNMLGDRIFQTEISGQKSEINLSIDSGVYFLNIETESSSFTQKIIIQE